MNARPGKRLVLIGAGNIGRILLGRLSTAGSPPILQGLIGSGMGQGPALSLLLAGPALSLPSMLTLTGIMGLKKTLAYCTIVVFLSTAAGIVYGWFVA